MEKKIVSIEDYRLEKKYEEQLINMFIKGVHTEDWHTENKKESVDNEK